MSNYTGLFLSGTNGLKDAGKEWHEGLIMARRKQQEAGLFPAERLARALVPPEEQPYPVPENWRWVRLEQLITASKDKTDDFSDSSVKYVGLEHMEKDGGIIACGTVEDIKSLKSIFKKGQILYGKLRPYLNKHDIAAFDGVCSTDILVFDTTEITFNSYINYYFEIPFFIEYVISNSKGINLPRVSEDIVLNAVCPLPPLAEQQRIVARIESLFAKLDEAREKAQAVVDGFENRKAAILHKAFTGELTKKWRNEHNSTIQTWEHIPFGELVDNVRLGLVRGKVEQSEDREYRYLKMNNITSDGMIDLNDLVRVDASKEEAILFSLKQGDFLFNTRNSYELVGKNTVWNIPNIGNMLFNNNIMRVRFKKNINPSFISYYLNSSLGKRKLEHIKKNTTNVAAIYAKDLNKITIVITDINEQNIIVDYLDRFLEKERKAKEAAEQVIEIIDAMKKAILARAFRGELGTNDPADESAEELLKPPL